MQPTRVTITGVTTSVPIVVDRYTPAGACALGVKINSGTATYTVEHTFDDVFAAGFTPAGATWYPHATLAAQTSNKDGNYAYNPTACRLNVTISSGGTCTLTVIQEGLA
jgi:hypothetical protein